MADSSVSLSIELKGAAQVKRDFTDIKNRVTALNKTVGQSQFLKKFGGTMTRAAKQFNNAVTRMENSLKRLKNIEAAISQAKKQQSNQAQAGMRREAQEIQKLMNATRQYQRLTARAERTGFGKGVTAPLGRAVLQYQADLKANSSMQGAQRQLGDVKALRRYNTALDRTMEKFRNMNGTLDTAIRRMGTMNMRMGSFRNILMNTGVALAGITSILGFREVLDAVRNIQRFEFTIQAASNGSKQLQGNLAFLNKTANELGIGLADVGQPFGRFILAAKQSGIEGDIANQAFAKIAASMRNLGGSAADTAGVVRAFEQSLSKGKFMAEEVRLQLGDRLPVAMAALQTATGMTGEELNKAFEDGILYTDKYFLPFVDALFQATGGQDQLKTSTQGLAASQSRLSNAFLRASKALGDAGFTQAVTDMNSAFADMLESEQMNSFLETLGGLANKAGDAFKYMAENLEEVAAVLVGLGTLLAGSAIVKLVTTLGTIATRINPYVAAITSLAAAVAAFTSLHGNEKLDPIQQRVKDVNDNLGNMHTDVASNLDSQGLPYLSRERAQRMYVREFGGYPNYNEATDYHDFMTKTGNKAIMRRAEMNSFIEPMINDVMSLREMFIKHQKIVGASGMISDKGSDGPMGITVDDGTYGEFKRDTIGIKMRGDNMSNEQEFLQERVKRINKVTQAASDMDALMKIAVGSELENVDKLLEKKKLEFDVRDQVNKAIADGTVTTQAEADELRKSLTNLGLQEIKLEETIDTRNKAADAAEAQKDATQELADELKQALVTRRETVDGVEAEIDATKKRAIAAEGGADALKRFDAEQKIANKLTKTRNELLEAGVPPLMAEIALLELKAALTRELNALDAIRQKAEEEREKREAERRAKERQSARDKLADVKQQVADLRGENDARERGKGALEKFNDELKIQNQLRTAENALQSIHITQKERELVLMQLEQQLRRQQAQEAPPQTLMEGVKDAGGNLKDYFESADSPAEALSSSLENAFYTAEAALETFIKTGKGSFKDLAQSIIIDIGYAMAKAFAFKAINTALNAAGVPITLSAMGNVMTKDGPMPLRSYSQGGIATSPQLSVFGEGSQPEAYVPLPDGRTIPVTMNGGGQSVVVNQHFDFSNADEGTEAKLRQAAGAIMAQTKASLLQDIQDGGSVSKVVGRRG